MRKKCQMREILLEPFPTSVHFFERKLQISPLLAENFCQANSSGPKFTETGMVILAILPLDAIRCLQHRWHSPRFSTPRVLTQRMRRALVKASRNDSKSVLSVYYVLITNSANIVVQGHRVSLQFTLFLLEEGGRCFLDSIISPFWSLSCRFTFCSQVWSISIP